MELKLQRYLLAESYTMGLLFIDNVYFCDTIEDKYRGQDLSKTKVAGYNALIKKIEPYNNIKIYIC